MKYKVEITPSAETEIEAAYLYIRGDSPDNAVRWRQHLYEVAATLQQFLEGCSYALEHDLVSFDVRQKLSGNYRILFTIEADRVIVLHVRHAARRPLRPDEVNPRTA